MNARSLIIASALLASVALAIFQRPEAPRNDLALTDAPLGTEIYIWQRSWDAQVAGSIGALTEEAPKFCALGLEFGFGNDGAIEDVRHTQMDWPLAAELAARNRLSIAVRIHQNPHGWTAQNSRAACDLITALIERLAGHGITGAELQIDYDCPQSKLPAYTLFLKELRQHIAGTSLTFTALPCWLDEPAFPTLAAAADSYVLQIHALSLPGPDDTDGVVLCDVPKGRIDIQRAARVGRPFRVALPTYSSFVLFDGDGRVVDVVSEDLSAPTARHARSELVQADGGELAALVADLRHEHPATLKGIAWYRLPVAGDRMNWPMAAFRRVIQGERPDCNECLELRTDADTGAVRVVFANRGETDAAPPREVRVETSEITAFDGLAGYQCAFSGDSPNTLTISSASPLPPLRPGEELDLAWLRHGAGTPTCSIQ